MSRCVAAELLRQYLAEQLGSADRTAVEAHVETCARCQDTLARLTDDTAETDWDLLRPEAPPALPPADQDFLRSLKDHPDAGTSPPPGRAEAICFPGPPTAKGPLGQLDGYHIRKELGRGKFGVVYQAYDELDRLVALKVLRPERAASARERTRFEEEARAAAAVKHDHVVTVYRIGRSSTFSLPYLVMEYLDGESLSARLARKELPGPGEAAVLVQQVAQGMAAAHARGRLHRDIKPGNILLEKGANRAKITDFGLVCALEENGDAVAPAVRLVGTPAYMSPEQILAPDRPDPRSDVYSLGAVLYELLTGVRPFQGVDHMLLKQIVQEEPRPPRQLNDKVPRDLETITLKCLAKEPDRRYATARQLADDLQRWRQGEPIWARHVGVVGKTWRWCRRKPALAAASALAAVAVMALTTLSFLFALHQTRAAENLRWQTAEAETARAAEAEQRQDAERLAEQLRQEYEKTQTALTEAQRKSALLALDRGLLLCEQGEIGHGLLWLARGLEITPAGATDLQRVFRANLAGWQSRLLPLKYELGHGHLVWSVAFSPDGKTLATVTAGSLLQLWNMGTDPPSRTIMREWNGPLRAVAFSPDSRRLVTAGANKTAQQWDLVHHRPIGSALKHGAGVTSVAYSSDGKYLLTGSLDKKVRVWDVAEDRYLHELPAAGDVLAVAYSPDDMTILAGGKGRKAQLWNAKTGQELRAFPHEGWVWSVAFSPDSQTVLTGGQDGQLKFWERGTGKLLAMRPVHRDRVTSVACSRDGRKILTGSDDGTVRLWDAKTGQSLSGPFHHGGKVRAVAFHPDGQTFATGSEDRTARLWQAAPTQPPYRILSQGGTAIQAVAFSPDGQRILAGGQNKVPCFWWDVATPTPRSQFLPPHDQPGILAVAFARGGETAVTGGLDHTARLWDLTTDPPQLRCPPLPHQGIVRAVAFHPQGQSVLTGGEDGIVRLWDVKTGQLLRSNRPKDRRVINAVAFAPDGRTFLTGYRDKTVRLWVTDTFQPFGEVLRHESAVEAATFSADGRLILSGTANGTVWLWEAATQDRLRVFRAHTEAVRSVAFSPDGQTFVTGSPDGTARVWNLATCKPFGPPLHHPHWVWSVAFSPDGRTVLTGSGRGPKQGGEIRLWEQRALVEGTVERLRLWVQVHTGLKLEDDSWVRVLDAPTWRQCRERLKELGGPPQP